MNTQLTDTTIKIGHIIAALIVAIVLHLSLSGFVISHRVNVDDHWTQLSKKRLEAQLQMRRLSDALGYGGYIHHFKNIVLRDDRSLYALLADDADRVTAALSELNVLFDDPNVLDAIDSVRETFLDYRSKEQFLALRSSESAELIDSLVQTDDVRAIHALTKLRQTVDVSLEKDVFMLEKELRGKSVYDYLLLSSGAFYLIFGYFIVKLVLSLHSISNRTSQHARRLKILLEESPAAILVVNTEGRVTYANESTEQMFKLANDQLVGIRVEELMPDRYRSTHTNKRETFIENKGQRAMAGRRDLFGLRSDGSEFPIRISLNRVENEGGVDIVCIMEDITFEKQLNKKRVQQQRLEAVGQLTAGIAHDFNNMLAIISGNAEIAKNKNIPITTRDSAIISISNACSKATKLTRQLLSFSKKQELHNTRVNVNSTIHDIQSMIERIVGEDVELSLNIADDLWDSFLDKVQFESALMNIVVNAKHAMPNGGKLNISAENIFIDGEISSQKSLKPGDYVCISIEDTGIGMDDELVSKIFEPFFTSKEHGTGLGLSTVIGFVHSTGGDILVDSTPGKGTTFEIYFPKFCETQNSSVGAEENISFSDSPLTHFTIMIIEDDKDVLDMLANLLKLTGAEIISSQTESEALDYGYVRPIDLVICDVVLKSGENGFDIVHKLRQLQPNIKVVLSSGYSRSNLVSRFDVDINDIILTKPYSHKQLIDAVVNALRTY
ncbi:hybrid sensor histidine kinase/response regulator [Alteromonas facilis]|uniref:hybrid sensor histidine kinase/response regulator n=1 Tax=Alteromonas facilis TaxID=2048004 RepID=UPI000C286F1D|nr:ATP-binding protein [Alteromonas facilis]